MAEFRVVGCGQAGFWPLQHSSVNYSVLMQISMTGAVLFGFVWIIIKSAHRLPRGVRRLFGYGADPPTPVEAEAAVIEDAEQAETTSNGEPSGEGKRRFSSSTKFQLKSPEPNESDAYFVTAEEADVPLTNGIKESTESESDFEFINKKDLEPEKQSLESPEVESSKTEVHEEQSSKAEVHEVKSPKAEVCEVITQKAEVYAVEAPKTEVCTVESPKTEVCTVESPKTEVCTVESPKTEVCTVESLKTEVYAVESSKTEVYAVESPKTEVYAVESPKTEVCEESLAEESSKTEVCEASDLKLCTTERSAQESSYTKPGEPDTSVQTNQEKSSRTELIPTDLPRKEDELDSSSQLLLSESSIVLQSDYLKQTTYVSEASVTYTSKVTKELVYLQSDSESSGATPSTIESPSEPLVSLDSYDSEFQSAVSESVLESRTPSVLDTELSPDPAFSSQSLSVPFSDSVPTETHEPSNQLQPLENDHFSADEPVTEQDNLSSTDEFAASIESEVAVPADKMKLPVNAPQCRVLTLKDDEHQEATLYRLQKGWTLQFRLGPSLFGKRVSLYTNHPAKPEDGFLRNKYRQLPWMRMGSTKGDDTSIYAEVEIVMAGSFRYYFTYEAVEWPIEPLKVPDANGISSSMDIDAECLTANKPPKTRPEPADWDIYGQYLANRLKNDPTNPNGSGFFLVDPEIVVSEGEYLPMDCIQCQSVLSKNLGTLDKWEDRLRVAKESGYNAIHFTPVQELGGSLSCYSLADQLKLNSMFSTDKKKYSLSDLERLIKKINKDWKVMGIADIVLNHTANESPWIHEHPECSYNMHNCPHLRPAFLLDRAFWQFSLEIMDGKWESSGIPVNITNDTQVNLIREGMIGYFLPQVKIPELFLVDVDKEVENFKQLARKRIPLADAPPEERHLVILQDPQFRRLKSTIDMELALRILNKPRADGESEEARVERCAGDLRGTLDFLNRCKQKEIQDHLENGVDNALKGMSYERLDPNGPKLGPLTKVYPITTRYFTHYGDTLSFAEEEKLMYGEKGAFMMAHNGWVMGDNPLRNFAEPGSNVYLRRELICWGDSVKLRYGDSPKDCPYLWKHMEQYAQDTARIFHGIRLDNCHSTPIHVAEFVLDAARRIRPDLYVIAELFTSSETTDNVFVNRLGINSLIREALAAWNSHEQGRLVFRYGGEPVGAFFQPHDRPLFPSVAHAIFNDLTHDNPSAVEKRSVYDVLPSAALVGMATCASASNRGYDELVPHHIHVVSETRHYQSWSDKENGPGFANNNTGIIAAKRAINKLHHYLGLNGYSQVFVDQVNEDVVAVTRHNPNTHESIILVSHTAFSHPNEGRRQNYIKPLTIEGTMEEIVLEARTVHKNKSHVWDFPNDVGKFEKDGKTVNGLENYTAEVREHLKPTEATMVNVKECGRHTLEISFVDFTPGSVVAFKLSLPSNDQNNVQRIRGFMNELGFQDTVKVTRRLSMPLASDLQAIVSGLSLADLNRVLYRCDGEERDEGKGRGAYSLDHIGALPYCGLEGFITLMDPIRVKNDLGHPLCDNLRNGNWMMDYLSGRLKEDDGTKALGEWFEKAFVPLKELPRYLVPSYFDCILFGVYHAILDQIWLLKGEFIREGSEFVKALALGSVQMGGVIMSSPLPDLSPNIGHPKPPTKAGAEACTTLSAGLPHFTCGYMRNWGRDTFISIRGLFLLTGRHDEARFMILGYAGTLRHGLIPNLLDRGTNSRFNCRDATWWWLQCIQDYCKEVENGYDILKDKVSRLYPTDDSPALAPGKVDQPLHDVIQEAMQRHFQGVQYRERNAGIRIDEQMLDPGFNNHIGVKLDTGFVHGGNVNNCGTWMDKMGSSPSAGNKGKPATPRDGSAIEIVGLSKSTVRWLSQIHKQGLYPYPGVKRAEDGRETTWSWQDWNNQLEKSFELHFWVNTTPVPEKEPQPEMINRRGIYKDSVGASQPWADYQLRPNVPIAMVVAPEMFNAKNAWTALDNMEKLLVGPLGMRTLDPGDWSYNGNYDNSNDGHDGKVARGFNYHQGPEWVWPMGFYLRARLHFAEKVGGQSLLNKTIVRVKTILSRHYEEVKSSAWRGLPELTNMNGEVCRDSCTTQAWSMGCILEVLHDLNQLDSHTGTMVLDERAKK